MTNVGTEVCIAKKLINKNNWVQALFESNLVEIVEIHPSIWNNFNGSLKKFFFEISIFHDVKII